MTSSVLMSFNVEKKKEAESMGFLEKEIKKQNFETFDLTYENAILNNLVIGSTGTGKTSTVILPMIENLIKNNTPGLILDIKNNLTDYIYNIAEKYNKKDMLIELSIFPTGKKVNILNGIDKETLKTLIKNSFPIDIHSNKDPYWTIQGLKIIEDVIDVYFILKETLEDIPELSFLTFNTILNNEKNARKIYNLFLQKCKKHPEYKEIINRINSYAFHIFKNPDNFDNKETYHSQLTWTKTNVFNYFEALGTLPYFNFNYIYNKDFILDFNDLFYKQKKIVILRLDFIFDNLEQKFLSNFIRQKMIKDLISSGNKTEYTFNLIDEFQTVASFKDFGFNDEHWFDKSREFKNIQIISVQSLSALYSVSQGNYTAVQSLLNNCRNKIILNNYDIETLNYFDKYTDFFSNYISPLNLQLGEGLLFTFDYKSKKNSLFNIKLFFKEYKSKNKPEINKIYKEFVEKKYTETFNFLLKKLQIFKENQSSVNDLENQYLNFDEYLENMSGKLTLKLEDINNKISGSISDLESNRYGFYDISLYGKIKESRMFFKKEVAFSDSKIVYSNPVILFNSILSISEYLTILDEKTFEKITSDNIKFLQFLNDLTIDDLIFINPADALIYLFNGFYLKDEELDTLFQASSYYIDMLNFIKKMEPVFKKYNFKIKEEFISSKFIFSKIKEKIYFLAKEIDPKLNLRKVLSEQNNLQFSEQDFIFNKFLEELMYQFDINEHQPFYNYKDYIEPLINPVIKKKLQQIIQKINS